MKTLIKLFVAIILIIVILSQMNYECAINEARKVDTDAEIVSVLHNHGFRVDIYEEITPQEKILALFR